MGRWGLERLQKLKKGFWIIETLFPWEGPPGCVALSFLYSSWLSFAVWVRHILYPPEYYRKVLTTYICLYTVRALPGSSFAMLLSWWIPVQGEASALGCPGTPWRSSVNHSGFSQRDRVTLYYRIKELLQELDCGRRSGSEGVKGRVGGWGKESPTSQTGELTHPATEGGPWGGAVKRSTEALARSSCGLQPRVRW